MDAEDIWKRIDPPATPEEIKFNKAILAVHRAFAEVENAFALVLYYAIGSKDPEIASRIYFSPNATETRVSIVDSVVRRVCEHQLRSKKALYGRILAEWRYLLNRFTRLRQTRNKIIHGQVSREKTSGGKIVFRLVPLLMDHERHHDMISGKQLPGMSANDIARNAIALTDVKDDIVSFCTLVSRYKIYSTETLLEILVKLEGQHHSGAHIGDDRNSIARGDPPPS